MVSSPVFDRLPDEVLQLILYYAMKSKVPLCLDYCLERPLRTSPEPSPQHLPQRPLSTRKRHSSPIDFSRSPTRLWKSSTMARSSSQDAPRSGAQLDIDEFSRTRPRRDYFIQEWQARHLADWLCVNATCRRFRRLGKEAFFSAKTIAISHNFPSRLRKGSSALLQVMSREDQMLALERVTHVVFVDNQTYSPAQLMGLPKCVAFFPRLRRCTLLFGYRPGDSHELITRAIDDNAEDKDGSSSVKDCPKALRELMVGIGVPAGLELDVAATPGTKWSAHLSQLVQNVYPILMFRAAVLARKNALQ